MSHIPGSINVTTFKGAEDLLSLDDEIAVYCSDSNYVARRAAYHYLTEHGFMNDRRYAGGLADWQAAGYPLESEAHPPVP